MKALLSMRKHLLCTSDNVVAQCCGPSPSTPYSLVALARDTAADARMTDLLEGDGAAMKTHTFLGYTLMKFPLVRQLHAHQV
jgi:hypothetical protein